MVRLKGTAEAGIRQLIEFQFHYGTIKRTDGDPRYLDLLYFNSTMVRLKVRRLACFSRCFSISIPLWYD